MDPLGLALVGVLVVAGLVFWWRGRNLAAPRALGRIDLRRGFPRTRGVGYLVADVDDVLDRTYAASVTEEGRAAALEELHAVQFGLGRRGTGYDPAVVDLHVDAMIVALQTGRDLPQRPGTEESPAA